MKVIADFCVVPIGAGVSLSKYVAACERVFAASQLSYTLHANGTNVEGEWEAVFQALKACHNAVHALGAPRIFTTVKMGTRIDKEQKMEDKIKSVASKL